MKQKILLALGVFLLTLGILLNRMIVDFSPLFVAATHTCALACFVFAFLHYRKNGKK